MLTDPVANAQVGAVMAPITGIAGVIGCIGIFTLTETEVQLTLLVTEKV